MELAMLHQDRNKLVRRVIEGLLLLAAVVYYGSLAIMHYVSPIPDVLPLLLIVFTLPLLAALATVHFIRRLEWLAAPLSVLLLLLAVPLLIVMHNFLDGLGRVVHDFLFSPQALELLQTAVAIAAVYFSVHAALAGLIGIGAGLYHVYRTGRQQP